MTHHLGMPNVQVAGGLGREAGDHLAHHSILQPDVKAAGVCTQRNGTYH